MQHPPMMPSAHPRRSWLAALLSFFVPGLGQAYLGWWPLGVLLAAPVLLLVLGGAGLWFFGREALRQQVFSSTFLTGILVLNGALLLWRAFAIAHAALTRPAAPRPSSGPIWRSVVGSTVLLGLLVATIAMHGYVALVVVRLNTTLGQVFNPPAVGVDPGPDDGEAPVDPAEPEFEWDGRDRINFLLVGVDEAPGREASLTDTILVLSVDPVDETAVMVSVPRDTGYVPLADRSLHPDGLYPRKINELASEAARSPDVWCPTMVVRSERDAEACGIETLQDTVGLYLGIPIQYFARIDLLGFERLIDAVGGVELCLPGRLVDPQYADPSTGERGLDLPAGCNRFTGSDALAYARSRQGWIEMADGTREPQNDFLRAGRQQEILLALRNELDDTGIFELPQLLDAVGSLVTTDFPRDQAGDLATLVPLVAGRDVERIVLGYPEFVDLPIDPAANYLLTPRPEAIRAEMEGLFGPETELEGWYLGADDAAAS